MNPIAILGIGIAGLLLIVVAVFVVVGIAVPLARGIAWVVAQIGRFIVGEVTDALRLVGAIITAVVLTPLTLFSVLIGRWSASAHFGRAIRDEVVTIAAALYRMVIGHPIAMLGLAPLTEGIQQRLPQVVKAAPGRDKPARRVGQFDGYTIIGSLKGGGSGGKLYVAKPDEIRRAAFERQGHPDITQVVIKSFSLKDGSTLPQIIRESRALDAARKLGLVLDHELTNERFYYVMRFVPGDSLAIVTQRLHATSSDAGLDRPQLSRAIAFVQDVLRTLSVYHQGGLWHKDIKPDNIIVEGDRASVVDLGLVTPLRSNMTLTTHGTEYFRDPELVRLALKGVKVHQVDGAKFDIYAAGAVLFSVIENSFPAHGVLSQVKKRCPDAIKWIIRRAMADYDQRYASASEMLADLDVVARARDPFSLKPIDLPSMRGVPDSAQAFIDPDVEQGAEPEPAGAVPADDASQWRNRPRIKVRRWLTGGYVVEGHDRVKVESRGTPRVMRFGPLHVGIHAGASPEPARTVRQVPRRSAKDQLDSARARVEAARQRAASRRITRDAARANVKGSYSNAPNMGVGIAVAGAAFVLVMIYAFRKDVSSIIPQPGVAERAHADTMPGVPVPIFPRTEGPQPDPSASAIEGDIVTASAPQTPIAGNSITRTVGLAAAGFNIAVDQMLRGARVLIISDARPPYAEPTDAALRDRLSSLAQLGLVLVNNPFATPEDDPADLNVEDLIAQLQLARGGRNLDSRGLSDQISEWLHGVAGIDYVVWVEPDPLSPGEVLIELFRPEARRGDLNAPLRLLANYTVEQVVRPRRG